MLHVGKSTSLSWILLGSTSDRGHGEFSVEVGSTGEMVGGVDVGGN